MAVELAPQLEATIREKVQSGQYPDVSAVIGEALALLEHRDRYARLRAAVAIGLEDAEAGRVRPWTQDRFEELQRKADEEDRLGLPISDDVQP